MSKQLSAKIGIFMASLTLILSIFALLLLNGSTAWFARNDSVSAGGFGVKADDGVSYKATLESFPVTDVDYSTGEYTVTFADGQSYVLPTEDPNGISYSEYKKALGIIINVTSEEVQQISIKLAATASIDTIDDIENWISNCIAISTAEMSEEDGKTVFTKVADTEFSFVTLSKDSEGKTTASKQQTINLVIENPTLAVGENKFYFIIEYKYSEEKKFELISYIGQRVMESTDTAILTDKKYTITYSNDIEFQIH